MTLPASAWSEVAWREGSNTPLASRFAGIPGVKYRACGQRRAAVEAETARHSNGGSWNGRRAKKEPSKYWLSTLPEDPPLAALADQAKLRWPIERDYAELKSELGLAHFEGRSWRGFHHHATLCIASYGFLIPQRAVFPFARLYAEKTPVSTLTTALAKSLFRCPCCQRATQAKPDHRRL